MPIFEIQSDRIAPIQETTFGKESLREREDLQRLLRAQVEIISPDTLVIAEEFCEWEDSRRRIDLLGIDKDANLVVIELKVTEDGGHMELQAIRYAAMVSAMTFEGAVTAYSDYLSRTGQDLDARDSLLEFLGWDEPDEDSFAQDVRIVLVSADFAKEITTAVMWLNDQGLDVRCVRMKPYRDNGRVLVDVQQVIPLPEAQEYQVRIREKAGRERDDRKAKSALGEILMRFWTQLLDRASKRTELHARISPSREGWSGTGARSVGGLGLNYVIGRTHPRVELYIATSNKEKNERIFDSIHARKDAIEKAFGNALGWERLQGKKACRIRYDLDVPWTRDETDWAKVQDAMIGAMIRLEAALRPALNDLQAE